ncbi:MAG: nucleotidyltransferase domain-containing protein [Chloroflexaceae bacterium]|nr:nucleotidyltransferase domain-containing protein [Chloroflexaceae bacterium]
MNGENLAVDGKHDQPPEQLTSPDYRRAMQQRAMQEQQAQAQRRARGWEVARLGAEMLKNQFGACEVQVFGSLVHGHWFSADSDVDLAAWGIGDDEYFLAVAWLQDIAPDFQVDLVQMERCRENLREHIIREGKPL